MRLTSLAISSYKSFIQSVDIPLSMGFNVFIGPNNCGKTNILDAVAFLARPQNNPTRLHHHRTGLAAKVSFDPDEQSRLGVPTEVSWTAEHYDVSLRGLPADKITAVQSYISRRIKTLYYEDFSDFTAIEKDYGILERQYPDVYRRLHRMLNEYFPEIRTGKNLVDIESRSFDSLEVEGKTIAIDRLGGGFRRVIVILLYALHPDYSVILIDEPEIHLHPSLIKKLVSLLSSDNINQIVATSHSPLVIRASNLSQVYRVLKDDRGSHVYWLGNKDRPFDRTRLVQELNADNLEMFFADKVLLVEGVSDRILMRGLIDRFYTGSQDIKVIDTHGKTNIDVYIDLMERFHIPYAVMLDYDALRVLAEHFHFKARSKGEQEQAIHSLYGKHIFILPNGTIEKNFPRKYQRLDSKPLNALLAAAQITAQEYHSPAMSNLKSIVDSL